MSQTLAGGRRGCDGGSAPLSGSNGRLEFRNSAANYTITNVTTDRSYNADATTLDEIADVLGTLIADLTGKGVL